MPDEQMTHFAVEREPRPGRHVERRGPVTDDE